MKTVEELFKEIGESKELQNELASIGKGQNAEIEEFLKKHDCSASAEEFVDFIKSKKDSQAEGEIDDDALEAVAGGGIVDWFLGLW